MSIKGRMFTGKLANTLNSLREMYLYATIAKVGSGRVALDTIQKKFAQVSVGNIVEAGSTDNILVKVGHGLKEGYQIRIVSTANSIIEEEVFVNEVIDADTVELSAYLSANLTAGDTFDIYKPVSERVSFDGSSLSTVISPPIQIIKNGVVSTVEDSLTPADVVAIPVKMVAADGTNITINAGDISVQNSAEGVNFDSIRIGDGTAKYAGVTANFELKTHDADTLVAVNAVNAKLPALGQALDTGSLPTVLPAAQIAALTPPAAITGFALEATQVLAKDAVESIETKTPALGQALEAASVPVVLTALQLAAITPPAAITGFSLETTQLAISGKLPATLGSKADADSLAVGLSTEDKAAIGAVNETAPTTDIVASGLNGRLQRIAQRLTDLIALFPTSLGAKTSVASLSVVLATDQIPLNVSDTAGTPTNVDVTSTAVAAIASAPSQAKWCKVYADKNNTDDIRIKIGGTVTNVTGIALEGGRTEDFMVAGDISHISVSGTQKLNITWRQ